MSEATGPPWESAFIGRMKKLREGRGISQADLAKQVAAEGLPFHQPTIQRIESGSRPVRLNEAAAIADVLTTKLEDMIRPETIESAGRDLAAAMERLTLASENFGSPPPRYSDELRQLMDDAKAAHDHYKTVCKSLGNPPDENVMKDFWRDLAKSYATLKLLAHQAAAWASIASIGTGEAYNEPDPLKLDEIERFAQRSYASFDDETDAADVPAESAQGEGDPSVY